MQKYVQPECCVDVALGRANRSMPAVNAIIKSWLPSRRQWRKLWWWQKRREKKKYRRHRVVNIARPENSGQKSVWRREYFCARLSCANSTWLRDCTASPLLASGLYVEQVVRNRVALLPPRIITSWNINTRRSLRVMSFDCSAHSCFCLSTCMRRQSTPIFKCSPLPTKRLHTFNRRLRAYWIEFKIAVNVVVDMSGQRLRILRKFTRFPWVFRWTVRIIWILGEILDPRQTPDSSIERYKMLSRTGSCTWTLQLYSFRKAVLTSTNRVRVRHSFVTIIHRSVHRVRVLCNREKINETHERRNFFFFISIYARQSASTDQWSWSCNFFVAVVFILFFWLNSRDTRAFCDTDTANGENEKIFFALCVRQTTGRFVREVEF